MNSRSHIGALVTAGALLGMGLGGFLDGILLHQILQWHNMLSSIVPPTDLVRMKYNMVWDGVFHILTWIFIVVGLSLLWRIMGRADTYLSTRTFIGSLSLGYGLFNVVEGVIDHQVLRIHHVRPGGPNELAWDIGFLVFGGVLVAIGWILIKVGDNDSARDSAHKSV